MKRLNSDDHKLPMRKADKPMWQFADHALRKVISAPSKPRMTMEYEIHKPADYVGI